MPKWKEFYISQSNIEAESDRSILVKMPHNSDYDGYMFWHSRILVARGPVSYSVALTYHDKFIFRLFKSKRSKYGKYEKSEKIEVDAREVVEAFERVNEPFRPRPYKRPNEVHVPPVLEPEKHEALDELKDD